MDILGKGYYSIFSLGYIFSLRSDKMAFNGSPTIGRVSGIPIQLHWTFILLLIISLISPVFFLYILLLFLFVTIHELAHSITAKRNNIPVKRIVLYPLGGGSVIDMSKGTPDLELRIAIVGPLSNFFMGGLLGIGAILVPNGFAHIVFQLLFLVNILLGVLNIIPAFPLDGSRVLRSYLERRVNEQSATMRVARLSNIIAWISMLVGILFLFIGNYTESYRIILAFSFFIVAIYIYSGSQSEVYTSYINGVADRLNMNEIITSKYIRVTPKTRLERVYGMLMRDHRSPVLCKSGNRYLFIMNIPTNIVRIRRGELSKMRISDFGVELPTISYKASVREVMGEMELEGSPAIVILRRGRVVGLVLRDRLSYVIASHAGRPDNRQ